MFTPTKQIARVVRVQLKNFLKVYGYPILYFMREDLAPDAIGRFLGDTILYHSDSIMSDNNQSKWYSVLIPTAIRMGNDEQLAIFKPTSDYLKDKVSFLIHKDIVYSEFSKKYPNDTMPKLKPSDVIIVPSVDGYTELYNWDRSPADIYEFFMTSATYVVSSIRRYYSGMYQSDEFPLYIAEGVLRQLEVDREHGGTAP